MAISFGLDHVTMVKILIGFIIVILTVFGLASHLFSVRRKKFINSKIILMYSIVVITIFTLVYAKDIFNDIINRQFDVTNAIKLYSYMNITTAIINYITILVQSAAMAQFLNEVKLFHKIALFNLSQDLAATSIWMVVWKAILFPVIIELALIMRQVRNEPERHILWTVYTLLPTVIANILPNCFFGALVICKMLLNALNAQLQNIVNEVNCMQTRLQMHLQRPYYRMQRFCVLADKMDVLAEKYKIICEQTQEYLKFMSIPFVCSLLCNLFGITAGFFTQYLAIAETLVNDAQYDVFNALTNSIFLIISLCDIVMQANICNNNVMAVHETGRILQSITLVHADVRFKQSVETFSLLVLITNYKIQPLRLLEVNVSLVNDVISAVTTFLLILIQSDLTLRFSLK